MEQDSETAAPELSSGEVDQRQLDNGTGLPPDAVAGRSKRPLPYAAQRRRCLILLFVFAGTGAFVIGLVGENSALSGLLGLLILPIALLFTALLWCHFDAMDRGFRISNDLKICLVLLFAVAFPYYVFRSRGWAAFKTFGGTLLVVAGILVLVGLGAVIGSVLATVFGFQGSME